ncbi:MAG: hypothetical protein QGI45_17515, partial [Myxococcota bacterium]|nr:hypothetical protein [Myxococcota bacterium]
MHSYLPRVFVIALMCLGTSCLKPAKLPCEADINCPDDKVCCQNFCERHCNTPCGNGSIDAGETCDAGEDNSDTTPNQCRSDCTQPSCSDGVVDTTYGEECDDNATTQVANGTCSNCELTCNNGFLKSSGSCVDDTSISDCADKECGSNAECDVVENVAVCTCQEGYQENAGHCEEIPEACAEINCEQNAHCVTDLCQIHQSESECGEAQSCSWKSEMTVCQASDTPTAGCICDTSYHGETHNCISDAS